MRRLRKVFLAAFLVGVLMCGAGMGIAFVEYSSFSYGGRIETGQASRETSELDYPFDPAKGKVEVAKSWYGGKLCTMETSEAVPENTVRYVVTYDGGLLQPYLDFYGNVGGNDPEPAAQGFLALRTHYIGNEMERFFESKDVILEGLKERKIYSWETDGIYEVKILVNPETREWIEFQ